MQTRLLRLCEGDTELALVYEMTDMENAVLNGDTAALKLDTTVDVMQIMTDLRREWGLVYPEEL